MDVSDQLDHLASRLGRPFHKMLYVDTLERFRHRITNRPPS